MFDDVKVGDKLTRLISSDEIVDVVVVTKIDDKLIYCGKPDWPPTMNPENGWTFDRATGIEEDEFLEWGVRFGRTGSRLVPKEG